MAELNVPCGYSPSYHDTRNLLITACKPVHCICACHAENTFSQVILAIVPLVEGRYVCFFRIELHNFEVSFCVRASAGSPFIVVLSKSHFHSSCDLSLLSEIDLLINIKKPKKTQQQLRVNLGLVNVVGS